MKLINFPEDFTADQKLDILFKYHNFERYVKIDEQDKDMIVMALNDSEVTEVSRDEDGTLVIGYANEEWEQSE